MHSKPEAEAQASKNIAGLTLLAGGKADLRNEFMNELDSNLPPRAKLNRLKKVAEKISKAVTPHSACKSGCSFCCHISVGISESEAKAIAKVTGRPFVIPEDDSMLIARERWYKTPCPFLKAGKCSIYEDRPLACRFSFNMADTPEQCDTAIPPDQSYVMYLNLKPLEQGYLEEYLEETWADIRDFFPPSKVG